MILSNIFHITTKVLYDCKRCLDGRISDCMLAMHVKCSDKLRKIDGSVRKDINRKNESISNGTMMTLLDEWKKGCNHSLKDLQVHKDCAWWKLKRYSLHPDIRSYPQGCTVCLKPFQHWSFQWRQNTFFHWDLIDVDEYIHTHFKKGTMPSFYISC